MNSCCLVNLEKIEDMMNVNTLMYDIYFCNKCKNHYIFVGEWQEVAYDYDKHKWRFYIDKLKFGVK